MSGRLLALAAIGAIIGCPGSDTGGLPRMGVALAFDGKNRCQGISPRIRLTNVPAGAASYEVELRDLDVPDFHHWSQTLAAAGPVIAEGAGTGYFGPCPPSGTHRYRVTVLARDAEKRAAARGETTLVVGR